MDDFATLNWGGKFNIRLNELKQLSHDDKLDLYANLVALAERDKEQSTK